ncbi:MAG: PhzF family phenazine biosynthesis protein, partial [Clostridiales Family XIII bacterium]|nr:PhzF family phenazine biosynthesis protein [Clostridiales Family XIII bacterium]
YFTPVCEVDICGHATIAAFHTLAEVGLIPNGGRYANRTCAGELNIDIDGGTVWMDMAEPKALRTITSAGELLDIYSIMGPVPRPSMAGLYPEIISTGLPDIILPVASRNRLNALAPDFHALAKLSEQNGVTGVHAFCVDADEPDTFHCRNFAPLYGIDEEAATGTANGALTYYLYKHGLVMADMANTFVQGEAMGRASRVLTRLTRHAAEGGGVSVRVGGSAVILAGGELRI